MAQPHYSLFQKLVHKIISIPLVLKLAPVTMHHIDKLFLKLSGGRISMSAILTGLPVLTLTTTGAKSGQPRTTPLVYIRDPQNAARFALIGSNWGQRWQPAWYHNLKANPSATCVIDGESAQYSAQEVTGEDYKRFWQQAVDTFGGYSLYPKMAKNRHIPIMLMTMEKAGSVK